MRRMQSASDGSFKREEVILALVSCKVAVKHLGADSYSLIEPGTDVPFVFFFPEVLTYRTVQALLERFCPENVEALVAELSRMRRSN